MSEPQERDYLDTSRRYIGSREWRGAYGA